MFARWGASNLSKQKQGLNLVLIDEGGILLKFVNVTQGWPRNENWE